MRPCLSSSATGSLVVNQTVTGNNTAGLFAFGKPEVPLRGVLSLTGDSGGPCFFEEGGRRWLIGIISHRRVVDGAMVMNFTSTF